MSIEEFRGKLKTKGFIYTLKKKRKEKVEETSNYTPESSNEIMVDASPAI